MREIVLDTETTGLSVKDGHRIIEIGAIELINLVKTGNTKLWRINPERKSDKEAIKVHGIEDDVLKDEPKFSEICNEFLSFIMDSRLIIHNAPFDLAFLNNEFKLAGYNFERKPEDEDVIDTMEEAKDYGIYSNRNLDSLISAFEKHPFFEFNKSSRSLKEGEHHGALKDAEALAEVYIQLRGGKQPLLNFNDDDSNLSEENMSIKIEDDKEPLPPIQERVFNPSREEKEKHKEFYETFKNPIWKKYL